MGRWQKNQQTPSGVLVPKKETIPQFGSWERNEGYSILFDNLHKQKATSTPCPARITAAAPAAAATATSQGTKLAPTTLDKHNSARGFVKAPKARLLNPATTFPYSRSDYARDAAYPGGKVVEVVTEEADKPKGALILDRGAKGAKMYHVPQMGWWDGMENTPDLGSSIIFEAARNVRDGKEGEGDGGGASEKRRGRKEATQHCPGRDVVDELGPFAVWTAQEQKGSTAGGERMSGADEQEDDAGENSVRAIVLSGRIPISNARVVIRLKWSFRFWGTRGVKKPGGRALEPVPEISTFEEASDEAGSLPSRTDPSSEGSSSKRSSGSFTPSSDVDTSTCGSGTASPVSADRSLSVGIGNKVIPKAESGPTARICHGLLFPRKTTSTR